MNLEIFDIVIFILGVVIGVGVSSYFKKPTLKPSATTVEGLSATTLQQDIDKKQHAIDSFFEEANATLAKTEELVTNLRSQLSNSAAQLSSTPVPKKVIQTKQIAETSETSEMIEPPRDYAPKDDLDSPGTLSEEFGLSQEKAKEQKKEDTTTSTS